MTDPRPTAPSPIVQEPPAPAGGLGMVVAGGGTGGHLFPGIAVAEEFLRRGSTHRVLFIGTERGIEKRVLPELGLPLRTLRVEGIKGRGIRRSLGALVKIPAGLAASFKIIGEFHPAIVLGVGGYASGPAVLAARLIGIPTAVAEQNALPGLTNRILGRFADRIFLTFEASRRWFPEARTMVTGNPIRSAFLAGGMERQKGDAFTVLVFGGSQGASAINRIVTEALDDLAPLRERLRFIHQSGEKERGAVEAAYCRKGFTAKVLAFIMDMAAAYREADLLICRAGATSIAELTAAGKAAILIPFPHAVNDHQTRNAEVLAAAGAAELIVEKGLTGRHLAGIIERFSRDPESVRKMERAAAALGNRHAAETIVDACLELIRDRRPKERG
ncbi:MAG: undecaprenyldiphospho-muramoylpentapeptide beta-N-acetylglucosaminyltransferase [Deltaproteobacteria bacterium]|nr:undecaprenyldiphospho-muramoylpentapeptide beta-N-acetylglucosaminyltransferase [Deltaproteobacteria bacterium]